MIIKTAFIGLGYRGSQLLRILQHLNNFKIIAIADPAIAQDLPIAGIRYYNHGNDDYINMLNEQRPNLVFITSPWEYHVQHAMDCIKYNSDIALEIKGGLYMDEYLPLANLANKMRRRIFPLENTLFLRETLAMYNLVQAGILGEIVCLRGGYRHDLRKLLIDENGNLGYHKKGEGSWRSHYYEKENGDIYPTHGLAPLCYIAEIGKNDNFKYLVSFSSKSVGLLEYIKMAKGNTNIQISMGDIIITQIRTTKGILLTLTHDTTLPRPRSLDFEIQGTRGIWQGERRMIYIENISSNETWESDEKYIRKYEHYYWKYFGNEALNIDTHHKGMDYIMLKAIEEDLCHRHIYPANIHDLMLWTSVTPLSKQSIKKQQTIDIESCIH